eukprot:182719_1
MSGLQSPHPTPLTANRDIPDCERPHSVSSTDKATATFALGLYEALAPSVEQCDTAIRSVVNTQTALGQTLDTLCNELSKFSKDTVSEPIGKYAHKLRDGRSRVTNCSARLREIHGRLERIRGLVRGSDLMNRSASLVGDSGSDRPLATVKDLLDWDATEATLNQKSSTSPEE